MDDIDEKLREILQPWLDEIQSEYGTGIKDEKKQPFIDYNNAIPAIKKAFKDEGYVKTTTDNTYRREELGLLTGQEWLERFEKELFNHDKKSDQLWYELYYMGKREYNNVQYRSAKRIILKAARKASGVDL